MSEKTKSQLIRESNISTYTSMLSKEDLLIKMFENSAITEDKKFGEELKKNRSLATKFSQLLESITLEPITTQQLLKNFYEEAENEEDIKCIKKMGSFVKIVHAEDYKLLEKPKTIKNKNYQNLSDTAFVIKKETLTKSPNTINKNLNKNTQNSYYKYKHTYGIHTGTSNSATLYDMETLASGKSSNSQNNFVNRLDADSNLIESRLNSSLSFIMIDNPNLRIGTKNSLELNTFFNTLSTLELSKCIPFFDVQFILPSSIETKGSNTYKTASVTQFLSGTPYSKKPEDLPITNTFSSLSANFARNINTKGTTLRQEAVETNMAVFTMPQTVNNFNEKYVGHLDNIGEGGDSGFKRQNSIHDYTRPFMTIKNFSVDIAPTQGLMSFKTGKLSLVLHDRTRMSEIAPFIKPDLFGSFGAEIVTTYGWSHIDGMDNNSENFLGKFLDKSKVKEKYIITNSSFSIDSNGQVNIDLSIAMRGPIDIRSQTIKSSAANKIKEDNAKTASLSYRNQLENIRTTTNNDFTIDLSPFTNLIQSEIRSYKGKKDLQKNLQLISYSGSPEVIKAFRDNITKIKANNALSSVNIRAVIDKLYHINDNSIAGNNPIRIVLTTKFEEESTAEINSNNSPYKNIYSTQDANGTSTNVSLKNKIINLLESLAVYLEESYNSYVLNKFEEEKRIGKVTESIIGNLSGDNVIDPFFNKDWIKEFYKSTRHESLIEKKKFARLGYIPTNNNIIEGVEYVTFGKFISSVIGSHMSCSGKFDEIQILSYTANDSAGLMSNLNLASFLIPVEELKVFIESMFTSGGEMTIEGIFVQVINRFIITRSQLCYGFSHLYKRENNTVKQIEEDSVIHRTNYDNRLVDIYNSLAGKNIPLDSNSQNIKNVEFIMPRIKLSFDTLVEGQKTICRISILDQNDNPYKSSSSLLKKANDKELFESTYLLNKLRNDLEYKVKIQPTEAAAARLLYYKESQKLINALEKNNIIKKVKETIKDANNKIVSIEYHKISSLDSLNKIKSLVKETMPSITYGTQNSAIIDASVTTVNESRLNTVYLTRADRNADNRNNQAFIKFTEDMPLRVMPQQANITIFGCPFVNFAQYLFLDFETGTTVDNQYAITGLKHDFSPGKFTTSLTLSYGDVYGKYENVVDSLSKTLEEQRNTDLKTLENQVEKEKKKNKNNQKLKATAGSINLSTSTTSVPSAVSSIVNTPVQQQTTSTSQTQQNSYSAPTTSSTTVQSNPTQIQQSTSPQQNNTQTQSNIESNPYNVITQDIIDTLNEPNNIMLPSQLLSKKSRQILLDYEKILLMKTDNRSGKKLLPVALEILENLRKEAHAAGFTDPDQFVLKSGYRSFKYQEDLFLNQIKLNKERMKKEIVFKNKQKLERGEITKEELYASLDLINEPVFLSYPIVTLPGSSHHQKGYAMDFRVLPKLAIGTDNNNTVFKSAQWKWLTTKSKYAKYLKNRVDHEPWHWEAQFDLQIKYIKDKHKENNTIDSQEAKEEIEYLELLSKNINMFLKQLEAANNLYRVKLVSRLNPDTLLMKFETKFSVKNGKEARKVNKKINFEKILRQHKSGAYSTSSEGKYLKQLKAPNTLKKVARKKKRVKAIIPKLNNSIIFNLNKLDIDLKNHNFINTKTIEIGKIQHLSEDEVNYNAYGIAFNSKYNFLNDQNFIYTTIEVKTFANDKNISYISKKITNDKRKVIIYVGVKQNNTLTLKFENLYNSYPHIQIRPDVIQSAYLRALNLLHLNDDVTLLDRNFKYFKITQHIPRERFEKYLNKLKSYKGNDTIKPIKNISFYKEVDFMSESTLDFSDFGRGRADVPYDNEALNYFQDFGREKSLHFCKRKWFEPVLKADINDEYLIYEFNEPIFDIEIFHLWKGDLESSLKDEKFMKTYIKRQKFISKIYSLLCKKSINIKIDHHKKITDFSFKNNSITRNNFDIDLLNDITDLFNECLNVDFVEKLTDDNTHIKLETADLKLLKDTPRVRRIYFDNDGLNTVYIKKGSVKRTSSSGELKWETKSFIYSYENIFEDIIKALKYQ